MWRLFQACIAGGFACFCVYAKIDSNPVAIGAMGFILAWLATLLLSKSFDLLRRLSRKPARLSGGESGSNSGALTGRQALQPREKLIG